MNFIFSKKNIFNNILITAIIFGVFIRCFLFIKNNSLFCDEVWLFNNIVDKTYFDLFNGLENNQIAPPLFLLLSKLIINLFSSFDIYIRDFALRIIPFICGIMSVLCFYIFAKNFIPKLFNLLIAMCLFIFNPLTINYSVIFKQYSLELFISTLLLLIFWNIIYKNMFKWKYLILVLLSPWLSLSSFFIVIPLLGLTFFYNKKVFKNIFIFYIIDCLLYYCIYLENIIHTNYGEMNEIWNYFGYFSFIHPIRILVQFGSVISDTKLGALAFGGIIVAILLKTLFSKNVDIKTKLFLFLPIFFTMCLSSVHIYPFTGRLILFLLPLIVIILQMSNSKMTILLLVLSMMISLYYTIKPLNEPPVRTATSGRQIKSFLEQNKFENVFYIVDDIPTFEYYLPQNIDRDKVIYLQKPCNRNTNYCSNYINNLHSGNYILIAMYGCDEKNIFEKINYNIYLKSNSEIIYFKK